MVRIFNTYGPRMALDDGRVVSNFVAQALTGQPMTIYGDGQQTRSFQYVSDLIEGARPRGNAEARSRCCSSGRASGAVAGYLAAAEAGAQGLPKAASSSHALLGAWTVHRR